MRAKETLTVLIVEDEADVADLVANVLRREGFRAEIVASGEQAVVAAERLKPVAIVMDIRLSGRVDGIEAAHRIRRTSSTPIVYLTGAPGEDVMNRALQTNPAGYLVKPASNTQICAAVKLAVHGHASFAHDLHFGPGDNGHTAHFIGEGAAAQRTRRDILELSQDDCTVLIAGETGTGKELAARAIHESSSRAGFPFVAVNCSALPESLLHSEIFGHKRGAFTGADGDYAGVFERAGGGTLLLDEISTAPMAFQSALLRVLEERQIWRLGDSRPRDVEARILVSTNQDLMDLAGKGHFRSDLLYRIKVARIFLPALRERREDIPLLAEHFLENSPATQRKGIQALSERALHAMVRYSWPGNVRELRNAIEFAAIRCAGRTIYAEDLPEETVRNGFAGLFPAPREEERVGHALEAAGGNRSEAARLLGISRATFYRRLRDVSHS